MTLAVRRRAAGALAAVAMAIAVAGTGGGASAQPASSPGVNVADVRLDALEGRYFATTWQLDPVRASLEGLHTGDDRLGDFSESGYARRIAFENRTLRELITIDFSDLSPEEEGDAEILRAHLELDLMNLDDRKTYRHDPTIYLRLADTAAQSLLDRDYAPAAVRVRALVERERAMPAMFEAALHELGDVDPDTAELSREALAGSIAYFGGPVATVATGLGDAALAGDLADANAAVLKSLQSFRIGLENGAFAHPAGSLVLGPERFNRMLQITELDPDLTAGEFERTAVGALERTRSQFAKTAARIDPTRSPEAVAAGLAADHPPQDRLIETATADIAALRRFVDERHLLTLPAADDVRVVDAPAYARTSSASMSAAGPLERGASVGYFDLSLPAPGTPAAEREDQLGLFNDYALPLIAAHEVMPGHYVNAELDRRERLSPVRRLLPSRSFLEGWAHYVEQMLVEEGWSNRDPRVRLAQLQLELQRECRAIVVLRLHTQNMSVADATRFFVDNAYFPQDVAHREALRAVHDPLDGAYFLGRLEILKLRDDYRAKVGAPHFTLQDFHDALLAHGDPPIALVRKTLLGSEDDGRLLY